MFLLYVTQQVMLTCSWLWARALLIAISTYANGDWAGISCSVPQEPNCQVDKAGLQTLE
jgi:hypothetical protein